MAQIVQLKRSALTGKVPGTGSLNLGELALNTYDGKIFFRRSGSTDTVQEVITTNVLNTGSVTLTGTLTAESIVGSITASNGVVSGSSQVIGILSSLNSYTSSINVWSSSLATTGSNQFKADQNITGSLRATGTGSFGSLKVNDTLTINHGETIISGSALVTADLTILGAVNARQFNISIISSSVLFESGSSRFGNTSDDIHDFTGSVQVTGSLYLNGVAVATGSGAEGTYVFPNAFDFNVDDTTFGDFNSASLGYNLNFGTVETVGSPIYFVGGLSNLGDTTVIYPTSRSIDFVVDDRYVGSISSQSFYTNTTFTASLQQGYTLVGDSSGVTYAVATSSIAGALPTGVVSGSSQVVSILSSLNTYTGSNDTTNTAQNTRLTTIESVTGSYETKGRGIVSGSSQITFSGISSLPTLVSGSSQITYANISSIPAGIVSGSSQTITNLPTGTVSGSIQVLGGTGIISSSTQLENATITNLTITNLTTVNETASVLFSSGSNRFGDFGDDIHSFTGSVKISGSQNIIGQLSVGTDTPVALLDVYNGVQSIYKADSGVGTAGAGIWLSHYTPTRSNLSGAGIFSLRDNGDSNYHGLTFKIHNTATATDAAVTAVSIASTGTSTFNYDTSLQGNNYVNSGKMIQWEGGNYWSLRAVTSATEFQLYRGDTGATPLIITTGNILRLSSLTGAGSRTVTADASGNLSASSDSSLKQEDTTHKIEGLAEILQLKPRAYKWLSDIEIRGEDATTEIGFFADEVNPIIPSAAPKGNDDLYGFYDRAVIAALVKAIQEQNATITELKDRLTAGGL